MLALGTACEVAYAQPNESARGDGAARQAYTLEVDSDAPDVVSYEALAARIASDLGAPVVRPGAETPSRAAIAIRYGRGALVVRVTHPGGRVLERTVEVEGDGAAIQREVVLLAANLARDEAREILAALEERPRAPEAGGSPAPSAPPSASVDDGWAPLTLSLFYPVATNLGRPDVRTSFDLSILYGRVGALDGAQVGGGASAAGGPVTGAQIGGVGSIALDRVAGAQIGGVVNFAKLDVYGAQVGGVVNVARGDVNGAEIGGAVNVATRGVSGVQVAPVNVAESVDGVQAGVVNVARKVRGAQVGVINVAEEVDGAAVGLVSVSREGVHPIVWGSNLAYMNAGVKFATKYMYTITSVHYGTLETGLDAFGTSVAIGGHLPLPGGVDLELQSALSHVRTRPSERPKESNLWIATHVVAGYSFARHLRIFAGGGVRSPIWVDLGREVWRPELFAGVQF